MGKDETFATVNQLHATEARLTKALDDYKEECETDRKSLREEVKVLTKYVESIEKKTDEQTKLLLPMAANLTAISSQFRGILNHPRVKQAVIGMIIAVCLYVSWRVTAITQSQSQPGIQPQNPIIIFSPYHQDGG